MLVKSEYHPAMLRGAVLALRAVSLLGWIPKLEWSLLWLMARAPVPSKGERAYTGPRVL